MSDLQSFIYLSRYAGMREDLAQAGGDNSSCKISDNEMLIKASGFQIAELWENKGYAKVNQKVITDYFSQKNPEINGDVEKQLLAECLIDGARPSIETFLHSITKKFTLHTHSTVVNILSSTEGGWNKLKEFYPNAIFVDYATPGIKLAKEYFDSFNKAAVKSDIIFLKNHGLIVSGDSPEFVKNTTEEVLAKIENYLQLDMSAFHNATKIYDVARNVKELEQKIVCLSEHSQVMNALKLNNGNMWDYQFCPDCLVYCGLKALNLRENFIEQDFTDHIRKYGIPVILTYKNNVYILTDSVKKAKDIEAVLAFSARVYAGNVKNKLNLLSEQECNFLLNWDAEKYRQNMNK